MTSTQGHVESEIASRFPRPEELAARLAGSETPALLMATAHLTGDPSVLRPEWRPVTDRLPHGGLVPEQEAVVREFCLARLSRHATTSHPAPSRPDRELLQAIAEWAIGPVTEQELDCLDDALVMDGEDPDAPDWTLGEHQTRMRVAVIGAGLSGLLAGLRLKQAGIPFTIYEKSPEIGGTWYENTYPDCRVDVPSHIYTYSFRAQDWTSYFCRQEVVRRYLVDFATAHGLFEYVQFETEITDAVWNEQDACWTLRFHAPDGDGSESFSAFVSAVGQLNRPTIPDIPGRDSFKGPAFHSAQWDHSVDLTGKRIAVIGTGASALQFAPAIADRAAHVTIFQRTPPWLQPTPELRQEIPDDERWLMLNLPTYRAWYRFSLFAQKLHGQLAAATVDPDYPPTEQAVSQANDVLREQLTTSLLAQIEDAPWLRDVVVPHYPPGAKRIIRDDGTWIRTLQRDDVSLVSQGVVEITPDGVRSADGSVVEVDVILWGTGFKASEFLMPMRVRGEDGRDLHQTWGRDAAAFMGATVPGFPNMFMVYGPNTNVIVHANVVYFLERQIGYLMKSLQLLASRNYRAMSLRPKVFDEHQQALVEANSLRAWSWSHVNSWYKTANGRSPIMWPLSTAEFWAGTESARPEHYFLR